MSTTPQFLRDGFSTKPTASSGLARLWNVDLQPPAIDGGGEIDVTNMANTAWRTRVPKTLKTCDKMNFSAAYSPGAYSDMLAAISVNQAFTVTFPDGATLVFYGWINSFKPGKLEEGKQPRADVEIIPSNLNGTTETAPVMTPGTFGLIGNPNEGITVEFKVGKPINPA
jgi:hypothetical protein